LFDELMTRIGPRFRRVEPRRRSRAFVLGLLAGLPRKNCWTIAEHAGDATPDGMQHLLARARWDADGVRDDLRSFVAEHLGDPDAVLVADETGDLKKGTATAGVQRQYTGTAGRIENAQVAVYLGYAAPAGHALIDRELYLPRSWTGELDRCRAAGIPDDTEFATKPQLARRMIERAIAAGVPFGWFAADEAYGDNRKLRAWLEDCQVRYVLAVSRDHRVPAGAGRVLRAGAIQSHHAGKRHPAPEPTCELLCGKVRAHSPDRGHQPDAHFRPAASQARNGSRVLEPHWARIAAAGARCRPSGLMRISLGLRRRCAVDVSLSFPRTNGAETELF
jgi:SRSO17 transposase